MSDFIPEAARTLAQLAGTGATIAIQEASKGAGQSAAKTILGKIGGLLRKPDPDVADYEQALRVALDQGRVQEHELRSLVQQAGTASSDSGTAAGSVNVHSRTAFVQSVHHAPVIIDSATSE